MEVHFIPWGSLPGHSRLFLDYIQGCPALDSFFYHRFTDEAAYRRAAAEVGYPETRRAALVQALARLNPASPALERLARPGTFAVVTGQQVGLLGGPAYSLYKALTAIQLARRLTSSGLPAVAVFWLATEDHDLAEVNHCWLLDASYKPVRIDSPASGEAYTPVGSITVHSDGILAQVEPVLAGLPYATEAIQLAARACLQAQTFGQCFRALLEQLLPEGELLFLDPMDPEIRQLAAPLMAEAVERNESLVTALQERDKQLLAAGYHNQVQVDADASLLFLFRDGLRLPLRRTYTGQFVCRGQTFSAAEIAAQAEALSPGALLRPVVQDYLLPTVAGVFGPAEIAYLSQSQVLYRFLLGRMPVAVPRASFTVLDAHTGRWVKRLGLAWPEIFHKPQQLELLVAPKFIPPELGARLAATCQQLETQLAELRSAIARLDPTLAEATDRSRRKMLYQLAKIHRKVARELFRKHRLLVDKLGAMSTLAFPNGHPQERVYSPIALIALCGVGLLDALLSHSADRFSEHRVLVF